MKFLAQIEVVDDLDVLPTHYFMHFHGDDWEHAREQADDAIASLSNEEVIAVWQLAWESTREARP